MTWLPEWRVTVGDDVYTTVTSVSYATGRLDIDRQPTAGYCRVEIVNVTSNPFTIVITEPVTLELKDSTGTYVKMFTGTVSDFNIGVRSPEESGFITVGTILGIGNLARLAKAVYDQAIPADQDGIQVGLILDAALAVTWGEVNASLTWATYPATTTWAQVQSTFGGADPGFFDMIAIPASATAKSQTLADQIANSALGIITESPEGLVYYDDADHRLDYLLLNGWTELDSSYATPSSIQTLSQTARLRNSLVYKYGTGYASTYSVSDSDSIGIYGLFEKASDSNISTLADITDISSRELRLRKDPRRSLGAIKFRLDNPDLPSAELDDLLTMFCGRPIRINNLPDAVLGYYGGVFEGFLENIAVNATPTYVDMTLFVSAEAFSMPPPL